MSWLDGGLHFFGFAVCHTLPGRTLALGGRYLPVCARCSGIYLGVAAAYLYLLARRGFKVNALPRLGVSLALVATLLPLAVDGVTSYAGLRASNNVIRLVTGLLAGGALPLFAFPLLSPDLVEEERGKKAVRPFGPWYDYLIWAGAVAAAGALALWGWPPLYYPLAILAVAGLVAIFYNLALVIWLMVFERARRASRAWPYVLAAASVLAVFALLNLFHYYTFRALLNATGGKLPA